MVVVRVRNMMGWDCGRVRGIGRREEVVGRKKSKEMVSRNKWESFNVWEREEKVEDVERRK